MRDETETQLREQIEDLKEQVRYWRGEAAAQSDAATLRKLRIALGLTPSEAWLLGTLYACRGKVLRRCRIEDEMPGRGGHESERTTNCPQVVMTRIRKRLGAEVVQTIRQQGYQITDRGVALCEAAMAPVN